MGETSCYTMDLYCDTIDWDADDEKVSEVDGVHEFREFPVTYNGASRARCVGDARRDGWLFRRDGRVFCPKCSGKKRHQEIA